MIAFADKPEEVRAHLDVWEEVIISVGPAPDKREWRQAAGCSPKRQVHLAVHYRSARALFLQNYC